MHEGRFESDFQVCEVWLLRGIYFTCSAISYSSACSSTFKFFNKRLTSMSADEKNLSNLFFALFFQLLFSCGVASSLIPLRPCVFTMVVRSKQAALNFALVQVNMGSDFQLFLQ